LLMLGAEPAGILTKRLRADFEALSARRGSIGLRIVRCGDDAASVSYGLAIVRAFRKIGVEVETVTLRDDVSDEELADKLAALGADPQTHGIIVQEPYPPQINAGIVVRTLAPEKDVDCVTPTRFGELCAGHSNVAPATAAAVVQMLDHYCIPVEGKRAVVVGRSNIAGKPAALLLLARHATVTVCHTRTRDLASELRQADIIVAAAGRPGLVKGEHVREGVVVVDVGTNYTDGGVVGDVDFESVAPKAAAITPVPKGVGPLTNLMLASNLLNLLKEGS